MLDWRLQEGGAFLGGIDDELETIRRKGQGADSYLAWNWR